MPFAFKKFRKPAGMPRATPVPGTIEENPPATSLRTATNHNFEHLRKIHLPIKKTRPNPSELTQITHLCTQIRKHHNINTKKILRFATTITFTIFHKHVISWIIFVLCFETVHIEFRQSLIFIASIAFITLSRFFRPLCVEFDYTLCMRFSWLLEFFLCSYIFQERF